VNGIILNTRPKKSAHAYSKIWTKEGSPLVTHTRNLTDKVRTQMQIPVEYGMRYGTPTIRSAIENLIKKGAKHIIFLPLYPQYSYAASETAIVKFEEEIKKVAPSATYQIIEDFYSHPAFIEALYQSIKPEYEAFQPDLLLLTYHGIPKRQVFQTRNQRNYHAQSLLTSKFLREKMGLPVSKVRSTFQSRLGPVKWIRPYTDLVLPTLPPQGIKRILVASPSFAADCLETLEEIQMQYQELFKEHGGEEFRYVPCLNSSDAFVNAIEKIVYSSPATG
jgi:ferrochelatase